MSKFRQIMLDDYAYAKCGWFLEKIAEMTNNMDAFQIKELKEDLERMYNIHRILQKDGNDK